MIQTVLDWFGPLFSGALGYAIVALSVGLDRGAFIGLVAPGDVVLALAGIYAGRGELALVGVIAAGAGGGIAGEVVSYWLGRRYGKQIVGRLPFSERFEKYLARAEDYFAEGGRRAVFAGRYVSVVGTFIPFTAGMSGMPFPRFLVTAAPAVVLWSTAVSTLGYVLNDAVDLVDRILSRFAWGALALVVLFFAARALWRRRARVRAWVEARLGSSDR